MLGAPFTSKSAKPGQKWLVKNTSCRGKVSYIDSGIQSFQLKGMSTRALSIIQMPQTTAAIPLNQLTNVEKPRARTLTLLMARLSFLDGVNRCCMQGCKQGDVGACPMLEIVLGFTAVACFHKHEQG